MVIKRQGSQAKRFAARSFSCFVRKGPWRQRSLSADTVLVTFAKTKVTRPPAAMSGTVFELKEQSSGVLYRPYFWDIGTCW